MCSDRLHFRDAESRLGEDALEVDWLMKTFSAVAYSLLLCSALSFVPPAHSQSIDTKLLGEMQWRNVGPFRGGRTRAVSGVPSQPNVFYVGAVNGGVWKTNDFGRTWQPIFDQQPTGSIGAIEVAPSDPNVIYVGSGEGLHRPDLSVGDGIYKSTDGGATWTHLGLRDGQQISQMAIDPRDPNRLFVAVAGHPYGPNPERGVLSLDRWRTDVPEGPLQRRKHRRRGCEDRSLRSEYRLCHIVGGARRAVGERRLERHRRRNLQVHRWRPRPGSRWQAACRMASSQAYVSIGAERSQAPVRIGRDQGQGGPLSLGGCGRDLDNRHHRRAPQEPHRRRRLAGSADRSQESRRGLHDQHRHLEIHRWRRDLERLSRRARRRRLPEHLDQSQRLQCHHPDQRSGSHRQRERRPELEFVVQPAHGADVPRERRQCLSLSAVQRAAGERFGLHFQPRQRWRDHLPRLASGGGRGVRLRRARSAGSGHHLRRQADAL